MHSKVWYLSKQKYWQNETCNVIVSIMRASGCVYIQINIMKVNTSHFKVNPTAV